MIITLLTDFGLADPYAAIMKGVILGLCPDVTLVDISHEVPPQDIRSAAFMLESAFRYFPDGTIHCVVIDPDVGSSRAVLIVRAFAQTFIAPDNGVLAGIFEACPDHKVYQAVGKEYILAELSLTFHGRDIFAPVAAHLANGVPIEKIGIPAEKYCRGEIGHATIEGDHITGEIVYIDRFGNAVTNIHRSMLEGKPGIELKIGKNCIKRLSFIYAEVKTGEPLALIGSQNMLEISVREGSAKAFFGFKPGDRIIIQTPGNRSGKSSRS
jgi:S-adenosylmethionine hydrolase